MDAKHLIRIISDENLTEIMVRGNGMYLRAFDQDDESVDYTLFDDTLCEIDGGIYDDSDLSAAFLDLSEEYLGAETDLTVVSYDEITESEPEYSPGIP